MSPVHLICCEITLMAGKLTGCGTMLPMSTNLPPTRTMSSPSTVAAAIPTTSTTTSAPRPSVRSFTRCTRASGVGSSRSEEHTSELQSRLHLVCRLLLEKKKKHKQHPTKKHKPKEHNEQ